MGSSDLVLLNSLLLSCALEEHKYPCRECGRIRPQWEWENTVIFLQHSLEARTSYDCGWCDIAGHHLTLFAWAKCRVLKLGFTVGIIPSLNSAPLPCGSASASDLLAAFTALLYVKMRTMITFHYVMQFGFSVRGGHRPYDSTSTQALLISHP
jgi:hypothetical protein